jgi:hypothetical protein
MQWLNLPQVDEGEKWELWLTATGPFVIKKAMAVLTSTRCAELVTPRTEHRTGNLEQYKELAQMPQVWIFY